MSISLKHVMVISKDQNHKNKIPDKIILNGKRNFDKNHGVLSSVKDKLCYITTILYNVGGDKTKMIDELLSYFEDVVFKINKQWFKSEDFGKKEFFCDLVSNDGFYEILSNLHTNVEEEIINMKPSDLFEFILNKNSFIALSQNNVYEKIKNSLEEIKDLEDFKETWKCCVDFEEKMKKHLNYSDEKSYQHLLYSFLFEVYQNEKFEKDYFKITVL